MPLKPFTYEAEPILQSACARNTIIELHVGGDTSTPVARARMIALSDGLLFLDRPQVIGRNAALKEGQRIEGFFSVDDELYKFVSTVEMDACRIRLNGEKTVPGAALTAPTVVGPGQRREFFRTSLAMLDPIPVWLHQMDGEHDDRAPIHGVRAQGMLVDASAGGFGVRVDTVLPGRLKIFDRYLVRFTVPGESEPLTTLCELRQVRNISSGHAVKLGLLALPWPTQRALDRELKPLARFLTDVQRRARKVG